MNECVCGRRHVCTRAMRRGAPCPMRALAAGRRSQACGIVFSFTMRRRRAPQTSRCGRKRRPAQIRCGGWTVFVDVVRCAREAEESFGHAELQVRCRSWAEHIGRGPLRIVRAVAEGFAVAELSRANAANCAERWIGVCWRTRGSASGFGRIVYTLVLRAHRLCRNDLRSNSERCCFGSAMRVDLRSAKPTTRPGRARYHADAAYVCRSCACGCSSPHRCACSQAVTQFRFAASAAASRRISRVSCARCRGRTRASLRRRACSRSCALRGPC